MVSIWAREWNRVVNTRKSGDYVDLSDKEGRSTHQRFDKFQNVSFILIPPPPIYSLRINRRKVRRKLRNSLKQSFSAQYLPLYLLGLLWFLSCFYFRNTPMLSWPHSAAQGMLLQSQRAGCQAPSGLPTCGSTTCITVVINEKCSHRHFYQKFYRVKCDFFLFGLKVSCCDGIW